MATKRGVTLEDKAMAQAGLSVCAFVVSDARASSGWRLRGWLVGCFAMGLASAGCREGGDVVHLESDGGTSSGGVGSTNRGVTEATQGSASTGVSTGSDPDPTGRPFLVSPDFYTDGVCDVWIADCPVGEKCMPWASNGGNTWDSATCSPVAQRPRQPGEPCTVEGSRASGVDDCAPSSMCWNVDNETLEGTCVAFCEGTWNEPLCSDPSKRCTISGADPGLLILCLPSCDPIAQDCPQGQGCYQDPLNFICLPDASGNAGAYGDSCMFLTACDPGLFCAAAERVPDCSGTVGCCSDFCDVSDPNTVCNGAGQVCTPLFEHGTAEPGDEHVGVCVLPD